MAPGQPIFRQPHTALGIAIGDNVWIGSNVAVLDGVTIGSHSIIGAGSVVTRDVPASSIAAGNPARVLRVRGESAATASGPGSSAPRSALTAEANCTARCTHRPCFAPVFATPWPTIDVDFAGAAWPPTGPRDIGAYALVATPTGTPTATPGGRL